MERAQLEALSRRELQSLAKKEGIRANAKTQSPPSQLIEMRGQTTQIASSRPLTLPCSEARRKWCDSPKCMQIPVMPTIPKTSQSPSMSHSKSESLRSEIFAELASRLAANPRTRHSSRGKPVAQTAGTSKTHAHDENIPSSGSQLQQKFDRQHAKLRGEGIEAWQDRRNARAAKLLKGVSVSSRLYRASTTKNGGKKAPQGKGTEKKLGASTKAPMKRQAASKGAAGSTLCCHDIQKRAVASNSLSKPRQEKLAAAVQASLAAHETSISQVPRSSRKHASLRQSIIQPVDELTLKRQAAAERRQRMLSYRAPRPTPSKASAK
ncbi:uncharacterized protein MONBRDRAFT_22931 [Monosiga brevicollis MX1]|uniref:Uncharacterized protein n=1 Tax=Monosiga brevicollis TaxID=81824 RepID=A9USH7_MONBE|nr:uncharacterized protein MONBRDRAFT_22931 [Monosiga brevicollis MX1]EDQ92102.1 predicted protein [Monosiga brevicollis MX1]|eukprot:XP_001743388.1 hypothetical protein [Monosiga brevicollis MX1]